MESVWILGLFNFLSFLLLVNSSTTISINSVAGFLQLCSMDTLDSNTKVELAPGTYEIDLYCFIANLSNISIVGSDNEPSIIRGSIVNVSMKSGFAFYNVSHLLVKNVFFEHCGHEVPSSLPSAVNGTFAYFGPSQKAVLLFSHCRDVVLNHVVINQSFGFGIVTVNLLGMTELNQVIISNTDNFRHPSCSLLINRDDLLCSGSGAVFVFSDDDITDVEKENATLTIANSTFERNANLIPLSRFIPLYVSIRSARKSEPFLLVSGSGIGFFLGQTNYHLVVTVSNTSIQHNNGNIAGVVLGYFNTVRSSEVNIRQCIFDDNHVPDLVRGGGLLVLLSLYLDQLYLFPEYNNPPFQVLTITQSQFTRNSASTGGAIYFHLPPQNISDYLIVLDSILFAGNIGGPGAAIEAASIQSTFVQKSIAFLFQDIEAYSNSFFSNQAFLAVTMENSAVFAFIGVNNVTVAGTPHKGGYYHDNDLGVFLMSGGNFVLYGHNTFKSNRAFSGGAISLYDNSILFIHDKSNLSFIDNHATQSGGAIYINSLGFGTSKACAIQLIGNSIDAFFPTEVYKLNLSVLFVNNSAIEAGNSIYANPLYKCGYLPEASVMHSGITDDDMAVYNSIFNFETITSAVSEISSIPFKICLCQGPHFNSSNCQETARISSVYPGQTFNVWMMAIDVASIPVSSLLYTVVTGIGNATLSEAQDIRQIGGTLGQCNEVDFTISGSEHINAIMKVFAHPGGILSTINVYIDGCPPGFELDGNKQCMCEPFLLDKVGTTCNTTTYTVARINNVWIGTHGHPNIIKEVVYVPTCPVDYCQSNVTDIDLSQPDFLCTKGRSGLLCGGCKDGLSTIFGSASCSKCSNFWLFTIVLYALAGVMLVAIIFLLNLTVSKGTVIGLVFYVNVISVNANIFFSKSAGYNFFFVFISLLNLELGFPICFYNGMDEKAKVGFQFLFPAYLLFISVAIIFLSRWSTLMQKLTASSGVAVLATLFYLMFNKILRTVIDILSFASLHSLVDRHILWLFDGNVYFFTGLHILLVIVAVITIFGFIIPYILFLTLIKYHSRLPFWPRLKPLIDAYTAPYKDKWRNWIGLRLVLLTILCVIYAITGVDNPSLTLLLQIIFVVSFSICQAYVRPYKLLALELLDMYFLLNFTSLSLVTGYAISGRDHTEIGHEYIINFLFSLAFIAFCAIIAWSAFTQLRMISSFRRLTNELYCRTRHTIKEAWYQMKGKKMSEKDTASPSSPSVFLTSFTPSTFVPVAESNTTFTVSEVILTTPTSDTGSPMTNSMPLGNTGINAEPKAEFRPHMKTFSKLREPVLDFCD